MVVVCRLVGLADAVGACCFEFRWWFSGFGCIAVFWTVGFALDLGEFGGVVNWCVGAILAVSVVIVCWLSIVGVVFTLLFAINSVGITCLFTFWFGLFG